MTSESISAKVKDYASSLGFDLCGIARARSLDEHKERLAGWASSGMHGEMTYLDLNIEKRLDPRILFPGAKSLIVTGLNYYSEKKQGGDGIPVISRYAYGLDYHVLIKSKLEKLLQFIKSLYPETEGRAFVDTAPLLEKAWGREAGLGWPGKHSVLINKDLGSFFFIGILIVNIELEYEKPFTADYCAGCTICMDSCPTGAINEDRTLNSGKCIAYLTLESKAPIPHSLGMKFEGRAYGCDRCQEVCPWNNKAQPNKIPEFEISAEVAAMTADDWKNLSREDFKRLFKKTALGRRSYERFIHNIEIANLSSGS